MNPWFSKTHFLFVLEIKNKNLCFIFHFSHSDFRVLKNDSFSTHFFRISEVKNKKWHFNCHDVVVQAGWQVSLAWCTGSPPKEIK